MESILRTSVPDQVPRASQKLFFKGPIKDPGTLRSNKFKSTPPAYQDAFYEAVASQNEAAVLSSMKKLAWNKVKLIGTAVEAQERAAAELARLQTGQSNFALLNDLGFMGSASSSAAAAAAATASASASAVAVGSRGGSKRASSALNLSNADLRSLCEENNRRSLVTALRDTQIHIINAPREGKKLLVVDLDHTLLHFDSRSDGSADDIRSMQRPCEFPRALLSFSFLFFSFVSFALLRIVSRPSLSSFSSHTHHMTSHHSPYHFSLPLSPSLPLSASIFACLACA